MNNFGSDWFLTTVPGVFSLSLLASLFYTLLAKTWAIAQGKLASRRYQTRRTLYAHGYVAAGLERDPALAVLYIAAVVADAIAWGLGGTFVAIALGVAVRGMTDNAPIGHAVSLVVGAVTGRIVAYRILPLALWYNKSIAPRIEAAKKAWDAAEAKGEVE